MRICFTMILLIIDYVVSHECEVGVSLPWEMYTYIPQQSLVHINCTAERSQNLRWSIKLSGRTHPDDFNDVLRINRLNDQGFYQLPKIDHEMGVKTIQLLINSTMGNNGTLVRCDADIVTANPITQTTLLLYDPSPVTVYAEDIGIQMANISWSPSSLSHSLTIQNINQSYILTVTSNYTAQPKILKLYQPCYVFTAPEGAPPCGVYNFSVTATYVGATYTGDGCGAPSSVISRMLLSLPNIEVLNSSLVYSPVLIHGDFKLNVSFKPAISCEDYPVLNYTLEVKSSSSEVVTHSIAPNQSNLIGNLSENREYFFKVVVVNTVSNVSSSIRQLNTVDVQLVTAIYDAKRNGFTVQCDFIPGSDARGCMVVLVGESDNTTVNLTRFDAVVGEFINVTCPPKNYIRVIGYDIESDNKSIGSLPVPGRLLINSSILCPLKNDKMESSPRTTTILAITIPTTIIIIISIIIIMILLIVKSLSKPSVRSESGSLKLQPPSQLQQERFETEEPLQMMPLFDLTKWAK